MSTPSLSRRRVGIAVATLCALAAPLAQAQGYPSKPITIVVPYAPGLLSTMTGCLNAVLSPLPSTRAKLSFEPPGA